MTSIDPQDYEQIRLQVRDFVRKRALPLEDEIEQRDEVPAELRDASRDMGLFGLTIPHEYGGLELSMEEESRLCFELGYTTPALRSMIGTNNGIAGHVLMCGGTAEQKAAWLPKLASGDAVAAFALTEAEAGSDPAGLRTAAVRDGDDWVIDGAKRYITNAPVADVFMVFARTDPDARSTRGISVFLVPRRTPGVQVGPKDAKMGQAGALSADVTFSGVRVPGSAVVGAERGLHRGWAIAMDCLAHGRIHIAALCVGTAERLVDESVAYARSRTQSDRPIGSFQLVQGMIADSVTDWQSGRALVLEAARAFDAGTDLKVGPSCAKYYCSEMVCRVADRAVQIHGGAGYMRGVPVERFYRDVRLFRIYEGTSQIQQLIIARHTLGSKQAEREA